MAGARPVSPWTSLERLSMNTQTLATDLHISSLATLSTEQRERLLDQLTPEQADQLLHDWRFHARPEQLAPEGDWQVWLYLAGRGAGKTRAGAEWVREQARLGPIRIALIAPTAADARDVMVEGDSGILSVCWDKDVDIRGEPMGVPMFEPSKRRLTWKNGAVATTFSADEPDRLRGPQFHRGWCDELAAWSHAQEAWDMFQFGLRLQSSTSGSPRCFVSTTPRPLPIIRKLMNDPGSVVSRGSTFSNRANLARAFLDKIVKKYEGTRLGKQELEGLVLDDYVGALFTPESIAAARFEGRLPAMKRIVVAVDPSGAGDGDEDKADSIGIIVAGLGVDDMGYVLADRTVSGGPNTWGKAAVAAYHAYGADRIVAERNYGGAMVEHVIRTIDPNVSYKEVVASRGKVVRAEPVAALYEQGRVRHVSGPGRDNLSALEDQMAALTSEGYMGDGSPDRLDAMVWAITELMLGSEGNFGMFLRRR